MAGIVRFGEKGVYRLANGGLLVGVVLFGGEGFLGLGELTAGLVLEAWAVLGVLAGVNFLPLRGKLLCLSGAVSVLGTAVWLVGPGESLDFLGRYVPWLMEGAGSGPEEGYPYLHTALLVALCYLAQVLLEKLPRLKRLAAVFLSAGAVLCMVQGRKLSHLGMAFGLCYVVWAYVEWLQERWKKVRLGSARAYMLRILPFLALYLLLMGSIPLPEEPCQWLWAKNIYRLLRETLSSWGQKLSWGGGEGFGMAFSGFSDQGELGAGLLEEEREVMTLELLSGSPGTVYLTGAVYNVFDGRGWGQKYQGDSAEMLLDAAETLDAAREFGGVYRSDYLQDAVLRIRYQDFTTGCLFVPLKTWKIQDGPAYKCRGGSLQLEQCQGYGTEYELHYFQMNGGLEEFYRFLEERSLDRERGGRQGTAADSGMEALWQRWPGTQMSWADQMVLEELRGWYGSEEGDGAGALEEYREEIYEKYLGEAASFWEDGQRQGEGQSGQAALSREAAVFLDRITEQAGTDLEKLQAIERELSSYTYTLTPGPLPDQITDAGEFLDYFLLETRQGYCTYFATAFVLLARAEGIPARYVQGFCVPVQEGETAVFSNMAHAWPEAYLEGVGWVPFEPTPGYGELRYPSWKLRQPETGEKPEVGNPAEDREPGREAPEEGWSGQQESAEAEKEGAGVGFGRLAAPGLLAAVAGYLLMLWGAGVLRRYRYGRMSSEERFALEVSRNQKILSLLGLKRESGETLQELRERAFFQKAPGGEPGSFDMAEMLHFMEEYESVVYGEKEVGEELVREAVLEGRLLLELLRRENWWAYARCRLRL